MSATLLTGIARTSEPRRVLRRILLLDAVVTGVNGLVYAVAPGTVARLTGLDDDVLLGLGVFLLVFAAGVGALGVQRNPSELSVKLLIEANALWTVLSLVSPLLWFDPNLAGSVWIVLQALVVAGFAALQWLAIGLRADAVRV